MNLKPTHLGEVRISIEKAAIACIFCCRSSNIAESIAVYIRHVGGFRFPVHQRVLNDAEGVDP